MERQSCIFRFVKPWRLTMCETSQQARPWSLPRTWKLSLFCSLFVSSFFHCIFSSGLFCFSCSSPCFLSLFFKNVFCFCLLYFSFLRSEPVGWAAPTATASAHHVKRKWSLHVQRYVGSVTSIWCEIRTCRQGCLPRTDIQTKSVRLIKKTLQEQTWRDNDGAQGQSARSGKSRTFAGQRTPLWEGQRVPESGPGWRALAEVGRPDPKKSPWYSVELNKGKLALGV